MDVESHTAIAAYETEGERIIFTHTVVPDAISGRGVGSRLIAGALADARSRGLTVEPRCSFVRDYLDRHPDQQDLLA
nr:GNAT family N-acetyltransferase [Sphingomonas jejuensis]